MEPELPSNAPPPEQMEIARLLYECLAAILNALADKGLAVRNQTEEIINRLVAKGHRRGFFSYRY